MKGNIILIGMPGAGKSTVGVLLAKTMGMPFLDTDLLIQTREGKLLQNIIEKQGIDKFLKIEEDTLLSLDVENHVIATGGSVVYSDDGMKKLKYLGKIIYLEQSYEEIQKRLSNIKTRGVVMGEGRTLLDLYNERVPLYEKYADIIVDCKEKTAEETIELIANQTI